MDTKAKNLLIILGPTGAGKSITAIRFAKEFKGEIINCDSMQVYRGFDIGTDKVLPPKQDKIPHHLLDVADPSEQFTAAKFVRMALEALTDIQKRNGLPIITGGTGLYLKALLEGLFPEDKKDPAIRNKLKKEAEEKGLKTLWERLEKVDPAYSRFISPNDKVRIIRALEVFMTSSKPLSAHFQYTKPYIRDQNVVKIGLILERAVLYAKIEARVDRMFQSGIVDEVKKLLESGIREDSPPFRALGYKHVLEYLNGKTSLEEAVALTKQDTRRYAKRQLTWFKKMSGICWFSPDDFPLAAKYAKNNLK